MYSAVFTQLMNSFSFIPLIDVDGCLFVGSAYCLPTNLLFVSLTPSIFSPEIIPLPKAPNFRYKCVLPHLCTVVIAIISKLQACSWDNTSLILKAEMCVKKEHLKLGFPFIFCIFKLKY